MNTLIIALVVIPLILVALFVTVFFVSVIISALFENKAARPGNCAAGHKPQNTHKCVALPGNCAHTR